MKLCRHSYAADGSDRMIGKAPSRYRHRGWFTAAMIDSACFWSGNGVKGAYLPVEIFADRRKYNRLPLDGETRNTLAHRKETMFLSLPSRQVVSNPLPVFCSKTLILREVAAKRALPPLFWYNVNRQTNISQKGNQCSWTLYSIFSSYVIIFISKISA